MENAVRDEEKYSRLPQIAPMIELQGVRVHNLKNISLQLPLETLIVVTGVSGSGKSSLAFDTLFAEGQRRYIESLSTSARQYLDRIERPDADRIDHIPPAIAVRQQSKRSGNRVTVATATEIYDLWRLLFARIGTIVCPRCHSHVTRHSPESIRTEIQHFASGTRFQIAFSMQRDPDETDLQYRQRLRDAGFRRVIVAGTSQQLDDLTDPTDSITQPIVGVQSQHIDTIDHAALLKDDGPPPTITPSQEAWVIVDRLTAGTATDERIVDSLELALDHGEGRCIVLALTDDPTIDDNSESIKIDDRNWRIQRYHAQLLCRHCQIEFTEPEPRLFSFTGSLGACPECRGTGSVPVLSLERIIPDPQKSLREGAIAPWTTPAYRHELEELLDLAADYDIPADMPFADLQPQHRRLIEQGIPEQNFGGLQGFFEWLERRKYKVGIRTFLNRWRDFETCPRCHGDRLKQSALAIRLNDHNIAQACRLTVGDQQRFVDRVDENCKPHERQIVEPLFAEIRSRLSYLTDVGLDYLQLDRSMRTLSGGEAQRVALTATLGSNLVNTLFVFDEPSAGLHPRDTDRVIPLIQQLSAAGNSIVIVEHEEAFIRMADHVVEVGPGAGREGGQIVFQGTRAELMAANDSTTAAYLRGDNANTIQARDPRVPAESSQLCLSGIQLHNLDNLTVEFPLQSLCVITGVSGSGKSTLIEHSLYPAVCDALGQSCNVEPRARNTRMIGVEAINEVILVDQSSIGKTSRSNAATYLKIFDDIRKSFADTPEARLRNFTAKAFSFNSSGGGRCPKCQGSGSISIDMQFLADISMTCPECRGKRYQREVLEVKYRGLNIADVLDLTVADAFTFFRSQRRIQRCLKTLIDVGLAYLPLGQPATTLSGGESQRLKLAAFLNRPHSGAESSTSRDVTPNDVSSNPASRMTAGNRTGTLFLLDEPTIGLHAADVARLLQCFETLLSVGHSLVVIEHNLDLIRAADWIIDLGPEAGEAGGRIVASGTPEDICRSTDSVTAQYLRAAMDRE